MPNKYSDVQDENKNIQGIKINKPDFDLKDSTRQTTTTAED